MLQVTEKNLFVAKQPQKIFRDYHVPLAVVVDMIHQAYEQTEHSMKEFLGDRYDEYKKLEPLSLSSAGNAARWHTYQKNVFVVRIHYQFSESAQPLHKYAVLVHHAEIMDEKEYQPIMTL